MRRASLYRRVGSLLLGATLTAGLTVVASATHRPEFRFVVLGFVTDAGGQPVADARVVVTRLKTGLEYPTRTEKDGFFFVVVRLQDEDEGERLGVELGKIKGEVQARFDPRNKTSERGTRVDARAGRLVENRQAFAETLRTYLNR